MSKHVFSKQGLIEHNWFTHCHKLEFKNHTDWFMIVVTQHPEPDCDLFHVGFVYYVNSAITLMWNAVAYL